MKAKRALRALKALVKLQALVRGHIVRKQTADTLRCMQSLVRVQSRARASRSHLSESSPTSRKSSLSYHQEYGSNWRINDISQNKVQYGSNWLDRWMRESSAKTYTHDTEMDKIFEINSWKPNLNSRQDSPSLTSLKFQNEKDDATSWTAENSPQVFSASSRPGSSTRRSALTPTRSEFSQSFFKGYSGHPNYMANTESYRAKVRSQSAPRQRSEFEKFGSTRSIHGFSNTMATTKDYKGLRD